MDSEIDNFCSLFLLLSYLLVVIDFNIKKKDFFMSLELYFKSDLFLNVKMLELFI